MKDVHETLCKNAVIGPSKELLRSLCQDLKASAKIIAAPQPQRPQRSDTHSAQAISKAAPRRNQSDLTRPKSREGFSSGIKSRTAPQRERSDTPKVTTGLREHMLDFHKPFRAPQKMNRTWTRKMSKTFFYLAFGHFFVEVYKVQHLPRKMSPRCPGMRFWYEVLVWGPTRRVACI